MRYIIIIITYLLNCTSVSATLFISFVYIFVGAYLWLCNTCQEKRKGWYCFVPFSVIRSLNETVNTPKDEEITNLNYASFLSHLKSFKKWLCNHFLYAYVTSQIKFSGRCIPIHWYITIFFGHSNFLFESCMQGYSKQSFECLVKTDRNFIFFSMILQKEGESDKICMILRLEWWAPALKSTLSCLWALQLSCGSTAQHGPL